MEEVNKWLNSERDYKTGVMLYSLYGTNPRLKGLFLKSENIYNREKLLQELKTIAKNNPAPKKTEAGGALIPLPAKYRAEVTTPSALDDLWELYKDLQVERNILSNQYHALLHAKAPKEEFARHYKKIEIKSAEMLEVWDRIHNRQKGKESEQTVEELKQEKKRLINQRSKLKIKLENFVKYPEGTAKRIYMEKEVAVISARYAAVIQTIKGL